MLSHQLVVKEFHFALHNNKRRIFSIVLVDGLTFLNKKSNGVAPAITIRLCLFASTYWSTSTTSMTASNVDLFARLVLNCLGDKSLAACIIAASLFPL